MFRALRRLSSGAPAVFAASGKPEAANTVWAPYVGRRNARNMLSF